MNKSKIEPIEQKVEQLRSLVKYCDDTIDSYIRERKRVHDELMHFEQILKDLTSVEFSEITEADIVADDVAYIVDTRTSEICC